MHHYINYSPEVTALNGQTVRSLDLPASSKREMHKEAVRA